MTEWAMAHPYLTVILAMYAFCAIDSVVETICGAIKESKKDKEE